MPSSLNLFYSYAHEDERHRVTLQRHLAGLRREHRLNEWDDRQIVPGAAWEPAIAERLQTADIVVLMISDAFIASDYCWGREMQVALERHEAGRARVIPVIVRPVDWTGAPFAFIQMLPKDAKPVTLWSNRDAAWRDVAQGVRRAIQELMAEPAAHAPQATESTVELQPPPPRPVRGQKGRPNRAVYDAAGAGRHEPGRLVRGEGDPPTGDAAVDEVYDALGLFYEFFREVFGRDSLDDAGEPLAASVHYGERYDGLFWNGDRLMIGDGDRLFRRLTSAPDLIGKGLALGVTQHQVGLEYWEQSGALVDSIATVFGVLIKQYHHAQSASEADWILGAGVFVHGAGLVNLASPGSAYDDPTIGRDAQPGHMDQYVETANDNRGVHINSGIPNHAFYLAATELGGHAWERAGQVWYETLRSGRLHPDATFRQFARTSVEASSRLYGDGSDVEHAVERAWRTVGVVL